MKKVVCVFAACCLLAVFTGYANAQSRPDKVVTGKPAENMKNVLENLAWIADGKDQGKHLYVLFSTSCIYCRVLFENTRDLTDKVQLRWIPVSADAGLDYMYDHPDTGAISAGFEGDALPENRNTELTARVRQYSMGAIRFWLAARMLTNGPPSDFALPTLLYTDKDTVSIIAGMPANLETLIKDIRKGEASAPDFVPAAFGHADRSVEVLPLEGKEYMNEHKEDMPIFFTPFEGAPKMGSILAGKKQAVPALGVTRDGYVLLSVDGRNAAGYIRDKAFVEKALGTGK